MIAREWIHDIEKQLPFAPTEGQREAIACFAQFMEEGSSREGCGSRKNSVMILRGSAGTGKTSVAQAVVRAVVQTRYKVVLLSPTGRAAKVLSQGLGMPAYTIHRKIYRQQAYLSTTFSLSDNLHKDTLFVVDEASMISGMAEGFADEAFGTGNLLDDLIHYVYSAPRCTLMLVGDTAQLPPVGASDAPALSSSRLASYGLEVFSYDLHEVLRQSAESGILSNAVMLRNRLLRNDVSGLPVIRFNGFADISICYGNDLIEQLAGSYSLVGEDETIVVTRSNKRANIFNKGIRQQVMGCEEELSAGDQIMVVKNNYFWTKGDKEAPPFLANGDRCVVRRVSNVRTLYGFRFAEVRMEFPDYDCYELTATVLLDTLHSDAPALSAEENRRLFSSVMEDYADIPTKAERMKNIRTDVFFNALQVKYAYAVTCHKAQGGQWEHVYVDQGYMTDDMLSPSYYHWLYTAFTRATRRLFLVNWPKEQTE